MQTSFTVRKQSPQADKRTPKRFNLCTRIFWPVISLHKRNIRAGPQQNQPCDIYAQRRCWWVADAGQPAHPHDLITAFSLLNSSCSEVCFLFAVKKHSFLQAPKRRKDEEQIQSTLVISNSKGLSKILWDIRTSTYQICRIEEKIIRSTTFNKYVCNWTLEVIDILKILWKRGEITSWEQFLLFSRIFYLLLDFPV